MQLTTQVDSAFCPSWNGKTSTSQKAAMCAAGKVTAGLAKSNVSLELGGWLKSIAGWLPVHRDQLRAQRSLGNEYGKPLPILPYLLRSNFEKIILAVAPPWIPLRSLWRSLNTLLDWGGDTFSPFPKGSSIKHVRCGRGITQHKQKLRKTNKQLWKTGEQTQKLDGQNGPP